MPTILQVEIDAFCQRVLAGQWPDAHRISDIRDVRGADWRGTDIFCGGFPCQDLSVAGKRKGLAGARSGLFHELVRVVDEARPRYLVWENVPGLLSSSGGRDFGVVLSSLADIGYFGAWRVLDSQFFGVAQRRRRLFGVFAEGDAGWRRAGAILLEPEGGGWHPAAGGEAGAGVAGASGDGPAPTCTSKWSKGSGGPAGDECQNLVAFSTGNLTRPAGAAPSSSLFPTLRADMGDHIPYIAQCSPDALDEERGGFQQHAARGVDGAERGDGGHGAQADPAGGGAAAGLSRRLDDTGGCGSRGPVCFQQNTRDEMRLMNGDGDLAGCLAAQAGMKQQNYIAGDPMKRVANAIIEVLLPKGLDSARYRACGNAVTVNVLYWLGLRMMVVDRMMAKMEVIA